MFDAVRNNKRIVQLFLAVITLPFAFWGVDSYVRNAGAGVDLAKVGETKVTQRDFQEALREQQEVLRRNLGERYDPAILDSLAARRAVLDQLVNQRLLMVEARGQGIAVSDEALRDFIASIPVLQENGKFSFTRYEALLREQGMTQSGFEQQLRQDLILRQLSAAVGESALVSKTVSDTILASMAEKRTIQEYRLTPEVFLAQVKIAEDDLQKEYERDRKAFEEPEQARVEYLVLSLEAIKANIKVSEVDARAWYETRKDRYAQPEERRASHILIAADKGNADARSKAKAKADALLVQVKAAPADFGKLAKQNSQDPGSAASDGDLGFFGRGSMVKPFEDTAFSLKDGEISAVVETDFGYHIIRLTGIRPVKARVFEEVRGEIEAELKAQNAQKQYAEAAESFSNMVYEQADSLKPAAEKFHLEVRQAGWVVKGAAPAPGSPFAHPKLVKALFADDVVKNKRNTEAVEIAQNTLLSARIVEYKPMALKPFADVREAIRDRLARKEATALAVKDGEGRLTALRSGKGDAGFVWSAVQTVSRSAPGGLSGESIKAVFAASAKTLPAYAGVAPRAGGYHLYRVNAVDTSAALPAEAAAALRNELTGIRGREEMAAYLASLRGKYKVEVNPAALEQK